MEITRSSSIKTKTFGMSVLLHHSQTQLSSDTYVHEHAHSQVKNNL